MKARKVGKAFIEHIPYIKMVIFSNGGFCCGFEETTVHFNAEKTVYSTKNSLGLRPPLSQEGMPKEQFLEELRDLNIENWDREYADPYITDGDQWELTIKFSDGHRSLKIYGSNAYPPHFDRLQRLMSLS